MRSGQAISLRVMPATSDSVIVELAVWVCEETEAIELRSYLAAKRIATALTDAVNAALVTRTQDPLADIAGHLRSPSGMPARRRPPPEPPQLNHNTARYLFEHKVEQALQLTVNHAALDQNPTPLQAIAHSLVNDPSPAHTGPTAPRPADDFPETDAVCCTPETNTAPMDVDGPAPPPLTKKEKAQQTRNRNRQRRQQAREEAASVQQRQEQRARDVGVWFITGFSPLLESHTRALAHGHCV